MYNLKNKISMARSIVHMDMDTFFVSCERLTNSKLIGLPLITVATEVWSLLVPMRLGHLVFVLQCLSKWRCLCPQAKVMKGDMELYSKLSMILQVIEKKHLL
jgi:DNA polymerase-4